MIRLILVIIFIILFVTVGQITLLIGALISLFNKEKSRMFYQNVIKIVFSIILFLSGCNITIVNKIDFDKENGIIIVNHRSDFDILLLYRLIKFPCGFIAKVELSKIPLLRFWMKKIDCLFLDRSNIRQEFKVILEAIENIKKGISYVIFPEGTRNKNENDVDLLDFKDGSFSIAKKTNCKIYPVAIQNSVLIFEKQKPYIKKCDIKIIFGEPVYYNDLDDKAKNDIGNYFKNVIKDLLISNNNET